MSEEAKQFLKHKSILVLVFLNETLEYRTQENKKNTKEYINFILINKLQLLIEVVIVKY